jgi:(p)ppGpp synthase/HD superfamily hydrolase
MKTLWFKDVLNSPKAKQDLELTIRNSTIVLGRLREILEEELRTLENKQIAHDYSDASWPYKQADFNADKRRIKWLIDLISIERSGPTSK